MASTVAQILLTVERRNVVSVEPGQEDIRDEFQDCKADQTRKLFSSLFSEREHPPLEDLENQRRWSGFQG